MASVNLAYVLFVAFITSNPTEGSTRDPSQSKYRPRQGPVYIPPLEPLTKYQDCSKLECNAAVEQANTLSKLSILDEYVEQTLVLLRDLMKSYDSELTRSATTLFERTKEETCPQAYNILQQILRDQKSRELTDSKKGRQLGEGMNPVGGDDYNVERGESPYTQYPDAQNPGGTKPVSGEGGDLHAWTQDIKTTQNPSENGNWDKHEREYEGQHSWQSGGRPAPGQTSEEEEEEYYDGRGQRKDKERQGIKNGGRGNNGKGTNVKENTGLWNKGNGNNGNGNNGNGNNRNENIGERNNGNGNIWKGNNGNFGVSKCRGVDRSSPHWVPGIDKWCVLNCSKGYCPITHCVCN